MSTILSDTFQNSINALKANKTVQQRLNDLGLDLERLQEYGIELGYNSGQFHLRNNKEKYSQKEFIKAGLLEENPMGGYRVWGKGGIVLPIRNKKNEIINLYSFKPEKPSVNVYLNDEGLFPFYPNTKTKKIYLFDNPVSLCLQLQKMALKPTEAVLSQDQYQLTDEFINHISSLPHIQEIILRVSDKSLESAYAVEKKLTEVAEHIKVIFSHIDSKTKAPTPSISIHFNIHFF